MTFDELKVVAQTLGEHFDAVQILVSFTEDGATHIWKPGCGNWFARQGMVHEFINTDIASENAKRIA